MITIKGLSDMAISYGVMAFKVRNTKEDIRTLAYQVSQITTDCVHQDIKITDCIITFGGTKDILREVKKLKERKAFDYLLIYSPKQFAGKEEEFYFFATSLKSECGVEIKYYKE